MNWTGLKRIDLMTRGRDRRAIRESIPRLVGAGLGRTGLGWTGLGGGLSAGASHTQTCSFLPPHSLCRTVLVPVPRSEGRSRGRREKRGGSREGPGRWLWHLDALGRFRNKHGQAGVSDLDLGGWRAAVIGGLGFCAVVRAWALLAGPGAAPGAWLLTCYSLKFYGV